MPGIRALGQTTDFWVGVPLSLAKILYPQTPGHSPGSQVQLSWEGSIAKPRKAEMHFKIFNFCWKKNTWFRQIIGPQYVYNSLAPCAADALLEIWCVVFFLDDSNESDSRFNQMSATFISQILQDLENKQQVYHFRWQIYRQANVYSRPRMHFSCWFLRIIYPVLRIVQVFLHCRIQKMFLGFVSVAQGFKTSQFKFGGVRCTWNLGLGDPNTKET